MRLVGEGLEWVSTAVAVGKEKSPYLSHDEEPVDVRMAAQNAGHGLENGQLAVGRGTQHIGVGYPF